MAKYCNIYNYNLGNQMCRSTTVHILCQNSSYGCPNSIVCQAIEVLLWQTAFMFLTVIYRTRWAIIDKICFESKFTNNNTRALKYCIVSSTGSTIISNLYNIIFRCPYLSRYKFVCSKNHCSIIINLYIFIWICRTTATIYSALSILRCLLNRNASYYETKSVFQTLPKYRNLYWLYW
jgi:hypothetical protein